jgi:hypothetical protein
VRERNDQDLIFSNAAAELTYNANAARRTIRGSTLGLSPIVKRPTFKPPSAKRLAGRCGKCSLRSYAATSPPIGSDGPRRIGTGAATGRRSQMSGAMHPDFMHDPKRSLVPYRAAKPNAVMLVLTLNDCGSTLLRGEPIGAMTCHGRQSSSDRQLSRRSRTLPPRRRPGR